MKSKRYDVAISFASEDRKKAKILAVTLKNAGLKVFFDEYASEELWGKDLHEYLTKIYRESTLTILVVSSSYSQKQWTRTELITLRNLATHHTDYTILPIRVDDSKYPSELSSINYVDLDNTSYDEIARLVIEKLDSVNREQNGKSQTERKTYHVIPRFKDWAVKRSGASRPTAVYGSKGEAISRAKELVGHSPTVEIVIHKSDGTIEKKVARKNK